MKRITNKIKNKLIGCTAIALAMLVTININAQSCADGSYSYDDDILSILTAKCGNCHTTNSTSGFNVTTYAGLLAGGASCGVGVLPGDATATGSSLIDKTQFVNGSPAATCGANMPTNGNNLTVAEYMAIEAWIAAGAQESCPVPPGNDLCADATVLACGDALVGEDTTNSTDQSTDVGCGMGAGSWYTIAGTGDDITIDITMDAFDVEVAIASGACGGLTNVSCTDGGITSESATFTSVVGTTYYIYIGDWSPGGTDAGTFDLSISCAAACVPLAADATAPAAVVSSESSCLADGITTAGGVIDPITCPAGQTAEYATDGVTFSTTLPAYDQFNSITVTARCVCETDSDDISPTSEVITVPVPCVCIPIADSSQTAVDCDNAIDICGASCPVTGTNTGNGPASDLCAVPACTGADGDSASWLTFVGDGGTYTFNTNGSDFDTQIAVFTDDGMGCVACEDGDDDGGTGTQSAVTIATTAGTTYFIVVDGFGTATGNWILNITDGTGIDGEGNPLAVTCPSAPEACPQPTACIPLAADATAPAAVVSSESSCQADGLTTDGGLIDPITCPAGQTAEYATDGVTFSTTLPVYDQLNPITVTTRCVCETNPDDISPTAEITTVPVPCVCTPVADPGQTAVDCDNAIDICGASCPVTGTNTGNGPASDLCAVPACAFAADGDSASWFTFVGDGGTYTFNTNGSDFDTQIAVFTDDGMGCVACEDGNDDGGTGNQSAVTITTTAGTTYFIIVDGFGTATGNWILNITDGTGIDGEGNPLVIACPSSPEVCPQPTACVPLAADATAPDAVISSESSCQADGLTTAGGVIDPITCPADQTAEYATDGVTFSTTLPVYDQLNPITVTTRCVCETDPNDISPVAEVTTVPVPCVCTPVADPGQTAVDCDNAIDICGASCPVTGTNTGNGPASDLCTVPACTGADGDSASWLTFVGDGGTYTFNTNGSDFDTQIAVFTDDGMGCLACEGGNDDGGAGNQSAVTITTTAGTTYFIVVDGFTTASGNWILNITDGTGIDGEGNPLVIACPSAPEACPSLTALACPTSDFNPPFAPEFICDGETLTQVPMAGGVFNITDPDGTQLGGMMWFTGSDPTVDPPADVTAPVIHSGADLCAADPGITYYAFVQCDADLDGVFDLAAGDQWVEVALHSFEVNPPAQMPMITRDDDVCNYTLTPTCPNDVLTPATLPAAAPGDDPAAVSINVTNEFGCTTDFMVDPPACPPIGAVCQGIDLVAGLPVVPTEVCSGATADICLTLIDAAEGLVVTGTIDGAPVTLTGVAGAGPNELCVTISAPANETCAPVDVVIQIDAITCADGTDYPGILAGPTLLDDLTDAGLNPLNVPVYPTLSVVTAGDASCGDLTATLEAANGTICATAAGSPLACGADGETLDYDFTADVAAFIAVPVNCPLPTLTGTLTCSGCACTSTPSAISTTDPTRICIDGIGDPINVTIDTDGGGVGTWVITDAAGIILALPPAPPFDLDGAGAGQCLIWYVNADDTTFTPMVGDDAAAAVTAFGCAFLSNPITVDRIEVTAATISSPQSPITICVDDGADEPVDVTIDDAGIGANGAWVITDAAGTILALPAGPPFVLDGAGVGTCLIWWVNYDDPAFAPAVGDDAPAIVAASACATLSNSIEVVREICDPCGATPSTISTTDPTRICIDGVGDPINVSIDVDGGATGTWVITDAAGIILALPPGSPFDLDGAGAGQCLIWYVNSNDAAFAPMVGDDAAAAVAASSCAFLSNAITVDRIEVTAAAISTTDPLTICVDDGIDEPINVTIDDAGIGANGAWVITDASGAIVALPGAPPFILDGAGLGTCSIWWVNYDDPAFAPAIGDDAAAIIAAATCAALSNSIEVVRESCIPCQDSITGTVTTDETTCVLDGTMVEIIDSNGMPVVGSPVTIDAMGNYNLPGPFACGIYTAEIVAGSAPPCYYDLNGVEGPIAFEVDGDGAADGVNFSTQPQVPTLSQWGLITLALLLMCFGAINMAFRKEKTLFYIK